MLTHGITGVASGLNFMDLTQRVSLQYSNLWRRNNLVQFSHLRPSFKCKTKHRTVFALLNQESSEDK